MLTAIVDREVSGRPGLTASRLAQLVNIERSRVSRLTQELVELEYLLREPDGVFRAGPAYFAAAAVRQEHWVRAARAEMRRLATAFQVIVRLVVPHGDRAVQLRYEGSPGAPESAVRPGMETPVWCGGPRALLWFDSEAEVSTRLAATSFTGVGGPRSARSVAEVVRLVDRDRGRGYVDADQEYEYGVREFGMPIVRGGEVVGALSVASRSEEVRAARKVPTALRSVVDLLEV